MADRTSSSRRTKPSDDSVGNFIVDQEIGKGSFAQVYSGRHKVRWTVFLSLSSPPSELSHLSSLSSFPNELASVYYRPSCSLLLNDSCPRTSPSDLVRRRSSGRGRGRGRESADSP